ncbi:MAG: bifunctional diguanylate cyclase/phosphodiesterase [Lachnospiraceae bacterium]|nr:bifunctional diguanylate cyclase/phosphodiesterase [Lachnospiraceae bacterium]
MRPKISKASKISIVICTAICVAISIASAFFARQSSYDFGGFSVPVSAVNGTLQAISFLSCLIMVIVDYKVGTIVSFCVLGVSIIGSLRTILVTKDLGSLPGTINSFMYVATLAIIASQLRKSKIAEVTDKLTGQINRYGFETIIHRKIRSFEKGSIVFLHLQGLTDINTNLGRNSGDFVLKTISSRIDSVIGGIGEAYKLEGSEFAIFVREGNDCEAIVKKLISDIEEKIVMHGEDTTFNVYVTCKAGIADCISKYVNPDALMKNADIAMNHALRSDVKYCFFNEKIKKLAEREHDVEGYIKDALENKYFYLVYQPQFRLNGKKLRGFEALIRMKLPDGSFVSPSEFIAVAERSDLILKIDCFVLRRAMEEFKDILEKYDNKLILSINISAKDIALPGFADSLIHVIESIGFPKHCLELEITEYSFAKSSETTILNINTLREHDIMFAIDDFGTGYTSLAQLLNLPVNLLKIDKSLIDNICSNEANRDFVNAVIYMGHLMKCEVISEGVEDEKQLALLRELGCDFVQGYVWSKPIDYTSVFEMCRDYANV